MATVGVKGLIRKIPGITYQLTDVVNEWLSILKFSVLDMRSTLQ